MNFFDKLFDFANKVANTVQNAKSTISNINSALSNLNRQKVFNSIQKTQTAVTKKPDPGVRLQVDPDPNKKIPVVYGTATLGGDIIDAKFPINTNQELYVAFSLCEVTGPLIDGTPSEITLKKVYMDGFEIVFQSDGQTAAYLKDFRNNQDPRVNGKIKIWFYNNSAENQSFPEGYSGTPEDARNFFPGWHWWHAGRDLVFAVVKITYDAENEITSIPDFKWTLTNTITQPGDVLFDYMTNTRYGAGIPEEDIFVE